jgi:hypothetical protein
MDERSESIGGRERAKGFLQNGVRQSSEDEG